MTNEIKRALVLAPHPDDGEFGCGGTLKKLSDNGVELYYLAFSPCLISLPEGSDPNRLYKELGAACEILGIPSSRQITLNYPVRYFHSHRQDILEDLVKIKKEVRPDLVLMPNSKDVHQDHGVIHQEGIRAFKFSRLIGYELPWNNLIFTSNFHVKLEAEHIEAKIQAIHCYESQRFRDYSDREFIFGLARARGTQINHKFSESFECIRWSF